MWLCRYYDIFTFFTYFIQVAAGLRERVLAYFGPPRIFHTDNGKEFTNRLLQTMMHQWNGNTVMLRVSLVNIFWVTDSIRNSMTDFNLCILFIYRCSLLLTLLNCEPSRQCLPVYVDAFSFLAPTTFDAEFCLTHAITRHPPKSDTTCSAVSLR